MPERLGGGEPPVGGAEHALEERVARLVGSSGAAAAGDVHVDLPLMVRTVRGFAESLITGRIGLPTTLPWPVGKKCTAKPRAEEREHLAAAEDESINQSPGPWASPPCRSRVHHALAADLLDVAQPFSSMVVRPPSVSLGRLRVRESLVLCASTTFW